MENKKGMSDVVTTVLIILFAIVAVAIIGGIIINQIGKTGGKITSTGICSELEIEPVKCSNSTCKCAANPCVGVDVTNNCAVDPKVKLIARRGAGGSSLSVTALSAIFEKEDGTTVSKVFATTPTAYVTVTSPDLAAATSANIQKAGLSAEITDEKGNKINCDYYKTTKIDCIIA